MNFVRSIVLSFKCSIIASSLHLRGSVRSIEFFMYTLLESHVLYILPSWGNYLIEVLINNNYDLFICWSK
jgi:hypothetical protein